MNPFLLHFTFIFVLAQYGSKLVRECAKEVSTLCKVISVQRNDTYPTVVQEKSHVEISCKQMHSIHILPLYTQVGDLRTIGLEFCSGILKVSQYIYI